MGCSTMENAHMASKGKYVTNLRDTLYSRFENVVWKLSSENNILQNYKFHHPDIILCILIDGANVARLGKLFT